MNKLLCLTLLLIISTNILAIRGETQTDDIDLLSSMVVSLNKYNSEKELITVCSGTIISSTQVLTAAHCFDDKNFNVLVKYGEKLLKPETVKVDSRYKRTDIYDPDWGYLYEVKLENDIAILEFKTIFKDIDIARIDDSELTEESQIFFSGYGQEANIFGMGTGGGVFRLSLLSQIDELSPDRGRVSDGASGICFGDSGGPVWSKIGEGDYIQVGVISQGDCNVLSLFQRINYQKIKNVKFSIYKPNFGEDNED